MNGTTYDAGALVAAEAGKNGMWTRHWQLLKRKQRPVVPAVVLAQVWRGGPQPRLSHLLRSCEIEEFGERAARATGKVLASSRTSDIVDAAVVVSALSRGDTVVTGDMEDLRRIAGAVGRRLDIQPP